MNRKGYLRVCLLEPNPLALEFLLKVLNRHSSLQVFSLEALSTSSSQQSSDIVFVIDNCGLPLSLGECLRRIQFRWPESKSIVIDQELDNEEVLRILLYGIDGYIEYGNVPQLLLTALRTVAQGGIWAPRGVLRDYLRSNKHADKNSSRNLENLTFRESQIVELVKRRLSNKEIADILGICESTVKCHLSVIYSKLHVANRFDLVNRSPSNTYLRCLITKFSPAGG